MPRLESNSGGTDVQGYTGPRIDRLREAQAREHAALIEKWSDAARAAAAAARRAKGRGKSWRVAAKAAYARTGGVGTAMRAVGHRLDRGLDKTARELTGGRRSPRVANLPGDPGIFHSRGRKVYDEREDF